jgi:DNA gyrase/topoisomerase IV subunit A
VSVTNDRTGLGPLETAVVLTMADMGATPVRPRVKSAKVVRLVAQRFGFGPNYAYEVLCDLARPWLTPLPLVDFHGNYGAPGFPAAEPTFTECRLSRVGWLASAAERSEAGPVPLGLINGTIYQGGETPPFDPLSIVEALLSAVDDASVPESRLSSMAGQPVFPGGCRLDGDIARVIAGDRGMLVLRSTLSAKEGTGSRWIDVTHLPPRVDPSTLVDYLTARCDGEILRVIDWPTVRDDEPRLPFREIEHLTHGQPWGDAVLIRCHLEPEADIAGCLDRLGNEPGVRIDVEAHLPRPLGALLRSWANEHGSHDSASGLQQLATLLR